MLKLIKSSLLLLTIASPSFAGQQSGGMPEATMMESALEASTFNDIVDLSFTTPVSVLVTNTDSVSGNTQTYILSLTDGNDNQMIFTDEKDHVVTIKKVNTHEEASPGEAFIEDGSITIDIEVKPTPRKSMIEILGGPARD